MEPWRSWAAGGVHEMAFAPASIVSRIEAPVLPPVAMTGRSGYSSRRRRTTFAVSRPAATLTMLAPAATLARATSSHSRIVATMGTSMMPATCSIVSTGAGALSTTP